MKCLLGLLVALGACGSDSPAPTATIMTATPDSLAPDDDTRDDLTITVRYDDHDGDLGGGVAEVHDCRGDELVTTLPIPAIAPPGVDGESEITGTLELHVNDVGTAAATTLPAVCSDLGVAALGDSETVFCVILIDAAGHRGTGDCTAAITLE